MKSKSEKEKIELKKRLARILRVSSNKICADCPEKRPTWISFIKPQQNLALGSKVLASFVCLECAGLHRKLGTHICVVRSISHNQFEQKDVECAEYSGNEVVNEIFEGHLQKSTMDGINIKPLLGAEVVRRERFIRQKYVDLYFYRKRAHYQHIAEVNKEISNSRKHPKSPGSKSSPTKPFRKKLSIFLHDENSTTSEKDAKTTSGCSTTVGNTTMTRSSTSRSRTGTERDDSNKSETNKSRDDSNKSDTKKCRDIKSSKKRSSKSGTTPTSRKKGQKKSSSQRQLKSKDQTDPMFGVPSNEVGTTRIGETSVPQKPSNIRKDLKLKGPSNTGTIKHNSRDSDDLSGMILVFDEESCGSFESIRRERRRSSRDLDRRGRSSTIGVSSSKKPTVDSSNNQNDRSKEFNRKIPMKSTSESCDSRDPRASSMRDARRSLSEITIDEITKYRDGSISPGHVGKHIFSKNVIMGPSLRIDRNSNNRFSHAEKAKVNQNKSSSLRRLDVKLPLQGDTHLLREHLRNDTSGIQNTSARNLKIPYLESSPLSHLSVEGFVSEETYYGFGDNTVNNMSGTGENDRSSNLEDNSTDDGFRLIDNKTGCDRSSSCKGVSWETSGPFALPFKNKMATDGAIKNQSGRRCNAAIDTESKLSHRDKIVANLNRADNHNEIDKSSRSIGNKSNRSIGNKSSSSFSNKSNMSIIIDEPVMPIHPELSKNQVHAPCDSPPSKKKKRSKSKKSRSKSSKSENKLNLRNQALLDEWKRLKSENQKKFVDFNRTFSQHLHA
jgi:hypothetical protein